MVVGFFFRVFVCPHAELFKNTHRADGIIFQEDFSHSRKYYTIYADLSLESIQSSTSVNATLRAPSFSLRVVLYEHGAAGLTRAFFFAKDGQTDGTDEAFADSIAVTETGGTEIDRTRSRWT